jgi:hypothetical protein
MFDMTKDLSRVSRTQVDTVARCKVLGVKVTITCPCLSGHPHEMSQHVRKRIPCRMQTSNLYLPFARLAEPYKRVTVGRTPDWGPRTGLISVNDGGSLTATVVVVTLGLTGGLRGVS